MGLEGLPARSAVVHVRGGPPARCRTSSRSGRAAAAPGPGRGRWAAGSGRRWDGGRLAAPGRSGFPVRDRPAEAPWAPPPAPRARRVPHEAPLPPGPELRHLRVAVQPQRSLPTRCRPRCSDPGHPPGPHLGAPAWPRQAVPRAPGRGRCHARAPGRPGSPGPTRPRPGARRSGPAAGGPGPSPGARPVDRRRSRAGSARPVVAARYPGAPARRFARPGPRPARGRLARRQARAGPRPGRGDRGRTSQEAPRERDARDPAPEGTPEGWEATEAPRPRRPCGRSLPEGPRPEAVRRPGPARLPGRPRWAGWPAGPGGRVPPGRGPAASPIRAVRLILVGPVRDVLAGGWDRSSGPRKLPRAAPGRALRPAYRCGDASATGRPHLGRRHTAGGR
jgi:hypothetical protein